MRHRVFVLLEKKVVGQTRTKPLTTNARPNFGVRGVNLSRHTDQFAEDLKDPDADLPPPVFEKVGKGLPFTIYFISPALIPII